MVHSKRLLIIALLVCCFGGFSSAQAAVPDLLAQFGGGALFTGKTGVQAYYARKIKSKDPLLKAYGFMATEHFFVLLRQTRTNGGSLEYQKYADGVTGLTGTGSFSVVNGTILARGSNGFFARIQLLSDGKIRLKYKGFKGTYRANADLKHF
jgi:hypothetical protein